LDESGNAINNAAGLVGQTRAREVTQHTILFNVLREMYTTTVCSTFHRQLVWWWNVDQV
jgi:hypothetical protein